MTLDEFEGPFAIRDHSLIPGELLNYLSERFYTTARLSRVPLDEINSALNEVWSGPGSVSKVREAYLELKQARRARGDANQNLGVAASATSVQTIDDFTESDFTYTHANDLEDDDGTV